MLQKAVGGGTNKKELKIHSPKDSLLVMLASEVQLRSDLPGIEQKSLEEDDSRSLNFTRKAESAAHFLYLARSVWSIQRNSISYLCFGAFICLFLTCYTLWSKKT